MAGDENVFIAGGYGLYKEAMPYVDVMYITEVKTYIENGDVFFPDFNKEDFDVEIGESAGDDIEFTRVIYRRRNA